MSISGSKITAPVSISDVNTLLGAGTNDLGSLCKHTNINMWAKYKPVVCKNLLDTTSHTKKDRVNSPANYWWQGDAGNCGLTFQSVDNILNVPDLYDSGSDIITYTPPSGGMNAPYRLTDFYGYNNDATPPIDGVSVVPEKVGIFTDESLVSFMNQRSHDESMLDLDDFPILQDCYYGYLVRPASSTATSKFKYACSELKLSEQLYSSAERKTYGFSQDYGTWYLYPFLATQKMNDNGTFPSNAKFYKVPGGYMKMFTLSQNFINVIITSLTWASATSITIVAKVTNKTNVTLNSNAVTLYTQVNASGQPWNSSSTPGTYERRSTNIVSASLAANASTSITYTITNIPTYLAQNGGIVIINAEDGQYTGGGSLTLPARG